MLQYIIISTLSLLTLILFVVKVKDKNSNFDSSEALKNKNFSKEMHDFKSAQMVQFEKTVIDFHFISFNINIKY